MTMPEDTATLLKKGRSIVRALKALSVQTHHPFSMQDKPGRFEIQKAVYLLKSLGYEPANKYDYNVYLNGPYSPDLAAVYYAYEDDGLAGVTPATDLTQKTLETVASALERAPDFLEGIATVIDGCQTQGGPVQALDWAKTIKPHLSEATWQEVRAFLRQHPELIRFT